MPRPAAQAKVRPIDRAEWERRAPAFTDYNYQQTWAYGEAIARRRCALSEHVSIVAGDDVVALADVRIKDLPVVGGGLAYVSGGPLVRAGEGDDVARCEIAIRAMLDEYVTRRGLTLRIQPTVRPTAAANDAVAGCYERAGFTRPHRAAVSRTIILDIGQSEHEVRSQFDGKWRNCLNSAEKRGLTVTFGTSGELFDQYAAISNELVARKGLRIDLDAAFYAGVQRELSGNDELVIGMVTHEGRAVAGNVVAMHGDTAVYLLGATTEDGLKSKASYVLQWNTIRHAQQRGMRWYDLGGVDAEANPGVYHFKKGMGGVEVCAAGPFEKSPKGLRRLISRFAEDAYVRVRRMRGGLGPHINGNGIASREARRD